MLLERAYIGTLLSSFVLLLTLKVVEQYAIKLFNCNFLLQDFLGRKKKKQQWLFLNTVFKNLQLHPKYVSLMRRNAFLKPSKKKCAHSKHLSSDVTTTKLRRVYRHKNICQHSSLSFCKFNQKKIYPRPSPPLFSLVRITPLR